MLADRYRIVGLIGRGGMGEVYRAEDLKLGQTVALKFLPESLAQDKARLERFFNEVRTARQVTHPDVCRVYDIAEVDGQHFISMEYIDGEDLATLLRRIGRLPDDKATQIARQLCAGLAAVHQQGILHCDLKPANVMIDGRGRARITDFGLAGLEEGFRSAKILGGTPSYMAPEQLTNGVVSVKSDLYSLGLVLYEMFTGRRAFRARTRAEMARLQQESTPVSPSSLVQEINPAVENVILRCLASDPRNRPDSAIAIAAALPGGDPLALALMEGKTPSPELVADAGATGGLRPPVAWICLVSFLIGVFLVFAFSGKTQLSRLVPLENGREVLVKNARDIIQEQGHAGQSIDSAYGFIHDEDHLEFLADQGDPTNQWYGLSRSPSAIQFWYRQSPSYLVPGNRRARSSSLSDPPHNSPGMARVLLDPSGRLRSLSVVPPRLGTTEEPVPKSDWALLFRRAGLEIAKFTPGAPQWTPDVYSDSRVAWEGVYPGGEDLRIRIEAGAFQGKPVYFHLFMPWSPRPGQNPSLGTAGVVRTIFFVLALLGGVFIAMRNLRLRRGDRKGAIRLALYLLSLHMLQWLFAAHHVPSQSEAYLFSSNLAWAVYFGALGLVFYLAFEPYFRRLWPERLVSWVRLLNGRLRDPLVGRDVLAGGLYGIVATLLIQLYQLVPGWFGLASPRPNRLGSPGFELDSLRGGRHVVASFFGAQETALFEGLLFAIVVLLMRLVLRSQWLTLGGIFLVGTIYINPSAGDPVLDLIYAGAQVALWIFVFFRFGLLSLIVGVFFQSVLYGHPLTFSLSSWYAGYSLLTLTVALALAIYGFHTSLAGRPLFKDEVYQQQN